MKKKIGTLYGKPIVEGDTNLVTNNEVHINNLNSNKNELDNESINTPNIKYYKAIFDDSNEQFMALFNFLSSLSIHSAIIENRIINRILLNVFKPDNSGAGAIPTNPFYFNDGTMLVDLTKLKGFSIYTDKQTLMLTDTKTYPSIEYIEIEGDIVKQISTYMRAPESEIAPLIEEANIKEITQEEYNKLIE